MSARTDAPSSASRVTAASLATPHKPFVALAIATIGGLGYLPFAPGTWGSLAGVLIYYLALHYFPITVGPIGGIGFGSRAVWSAWIGAPIAILLAVAGVWAADRAARFVQRKDPQYVVVDEVSGQFLTYTAALAPLNWKYLLLGLILFRVFDIWKPSPARQAESLPGGLGIMADDWIAGIYAAIGLWVARAAGL
jgi:phosphatidylglycerophosphatase A